MSANDEAEGSGGMVGQRAVAGAGAFGPNAWLVEDMYDRFRSDPTSVSDSWREFFADYRPAGAPAPLAPAPPTPVPSAGRTLRSIPGSAPIATRRKGQVCIEFA